MAWRMAWCRDGVDARNNLGIPLVLLQLVLEEWEHRLKPLRQAMLLFGQFSENARIHPEVELVAGHVNRGLGEDRRIVGGLAHEPEDMVRMEMRNNYPRNLLRPDAVCSHICDHRSRRGLKLTTRAGVEENRFFAEFEQGYVERNRHDVISGPRGGQCSLGFLNGNTSNKGRIVRLFPNAIVQDEPVILAQLERPEALTGFRSLRGKRSLDKRDGLGQAERCSCDCCRQ